jgi:hypothetical protein
MADIVGTGGTYSGPAKIAGTVLQWDADWQIGQFETTALSATDGAQSFANVKKRLVGTATLLMSDSNTLPTALSDFTGSVVLTAASGKTYSFTAMFSSVKITRTLEAGIMVASFTSSGAIT